MIADLGDLDQSSGPTMVTSIDLATEHPLISVAVAKHRFLSHFLFWRSHTCSGRSIDAMLYVKHLTHAHFVRGRTDTYIIGASAVKPHMDDTSAIFHILSYIIIIIIYYRRTSDRSNFAWRRTARGLTAQAHRCVKLKQSQSNDKARRTPSLISLCVRWHCAKYRAYKTTGILLAKR